MQYLHMPVAAHHISDVVKKAAREVFFNIFFLFLFMQKRYDIKRMPRSFKYNFFVSHLIIQ